MTSKFLSYTTFFIAAFALSTGARALNDPKSEAIVLTAAPTAKIVKTAHKTKPAKRAIRHRRLALSQAASRQPALPGPIYAQRADAMLAADDIAARRDLPPDWVRQAIGQARYLPQVAKYIQPPPPGTPKNWQVYRSRFIDPVRIKAGVKFWQDNRETLTRAQEQTGVPAEIIVGILGVETIYGQQMGNFRVIDALSTLAFDFPASHPRAAARSEFFKAELEQFLSLTHRTGVDPLTPLGSFAGAMGMTQFMPSSWVKYAIDFDGDDRVDLFNSAADAIGSVANYFKAVNWQPGLPTHYAVRFDSTTLNLPVLLAPDILPTFSVESFMAHGAVLEGDALQHPGKLALVELQNGDAPPSYVAGTENFYAITRYNWSSYYAMAVIELGQEVAQEMARARNP